MKKVFTLKLIEWHVKENKRTMPWKGEKEPYKIWLSEIILQQTNVKQGLSYYNNFIHKFPSVTDLAAAPDEVVFKMWEGLGYYSRCKNLLITARNIVNNLDGNFPRTYNSILALKGVGPYTAAAISSFAYGLPHAVVDGNVFRVLARYFGEPLPIDSSKGKTRFTTLAHELLYKKDPALYNQAIMDFGATICTPKIAKCSQCIFQKYCVAYKQGSVNQLPVKEKLLAIKKRWFTYFIFTIKDMILINKRVYKDIWENLYEFYLYETNKQWNWKPEEIKKWLQDQLNIEQYEIYYVSEMFKQKLTHQSLQGQFITITLDEIPESLQHFIIVKKGELHTVAFPKFINQYLQSIVN